MKKIILLLAAVCVGFAALAGNSDVKYKGNLTFGSSFGTANANVAGYKTTSNKALFTPEVETVHGALIGKNFFIGAGTGFKYAYLRDSYFDISAGFVPVFGALKCYIPASPFIAPYIMADLGYGFCVFHNEGELYNTLGGFTAKAGIGIEIDALVIAIGYHFQGIDYKSKAVGILPDWNMGMNSFFLKIGIAF